MSTQPAFISVPFFLVVSLNSIGTSAGSTIPNDSNHFCANDPNALKSDEFLQEFGDVTCPLCTPKLLRVHGCSASRQLNSSIEHGILPSFNPIRFQALPSLPSKTFPQSTTSSALWGRLGSAWCSALLLLTNPFCWRSNQRSSFSFFQSFTCFAQRLRSSMAHRPVRCILVQVVDRERSDADDAPVTPSSRVTPYLV
ncbi:hypothetical protein B0H65DRAFT_171050 [Neurospora tetraspora]|uniref:Secreted protein n=1 Tax=Neurospora tetraspora TaxID=94610 RepID=A0AAE0JI65_9PEZI|nr:hypothetical protein B0H65DRAFT_171050 [Neurospora tetraspora]